MRITDSLSFIPKNIDSDNELKELTDNTSEGLQSKEQIRYSQDKLEQATTNSLDIFTGPGILFDNAGSNSTTENQVSIDFLSETINQALAQPEFQENPRTAQMDQGVPQLKLPTESEKETKRLFDGAKDDLLKRVSSYAETPQSFDWYLSKIYGDNYNKEAGERIRQKILTGDESWLPKLEFVSKESLQGHDWAVDPSSKKLYLDREFFHVSEPGEGSTFPPNQFPSWFGTPENTAYKYYETGLWNGLRNELDPQDANNIEGRNFGTLYVDGKPTVVEWPREPELTGGIWGSPYDPPKIS